MVFLMVQNIFLEEDRSQNYFVFQPVNKHFKPLANEIGHGNLEVSHMKVLNFLLH